MLNNIKHYLMQRSRERKYQELIQLMGVNESTMLLDIGVNDTEYSPVDNYFEKKYPYPENMTVLSIQKLKQFPIRYPKITAIHYEGGTFPFENKSFNVVISNAVIEHVGNYEDQIIFVNEMLRVGEKLYFTTPAKEFPLEIHTNFPFIHWLPKNVFDKIVARGGKGWASGNYMNLLSRKKLSNIMESSTAEKYEILTYRLGPFPIHYAIIVQ